MATGINVYRRGMKYIHGERVDGHWILAMVTGQTLDVCRCFSESIRLANVKQDAVAVLELAGFVLCCYHP